MTMLDKAWIDYGVLLFRGLPNPDAAHIRLLKLGYFVAVAPEC